MHRGLVGVAVVCVVGAVLIVNRALQSPPPASTAAGETSGVSSEAAEAGTQAGPGTSLGRPERSAASRGVARPVGSTVTGPTTSPESGTLRIEADVPGASVFIDRQFIGRAPVTAGNLRPGTHELAVSAEGFATVTRTIDVEPGPREITVRLEPDD